MVRNEILAAFQQLSIRAEFNQRLLHFESALSNVYNGYDTAMDAHQQAIYDLGLIGTT